MAKALAQIDNLDRTTGLTTFVNMSGRTGDRRYLDFAPACLAVGVAAGEGKLIELAIHTAHTLHRLHLDPAKKLRVHWGVPGRRCPAVWARGQGWALAGLIGILCHLPDNHPDRPALVRYLGEIVDGLVATQNAEGL